jgi:hypothetical protein
MSIKTHWRKAAFAAAFSLMAATQASADMVTAVTNQTNWSWVAPGLQLIPGMATAPFANLANQRFAVTFSAECAVNAPAGNTSAWVDVDIRVLTPALVLVATLAPTSGAADAFCSANGTLGYDGWAMHSVTAVSPATLPAGNYIVQVRSRLNNGATGGWLGDRSLVVWR